MNCAKAWKQVWNLEVLNEISLSLSSLKQKRWLNRFVLLPFAKLLRYEMSDFHGLKYKNNSTWNQDPVHSMRTNFIWKITVSRPKNRAEDTTNCQKNQKKLVTDVLKDPKTSLERIRVPHNAFSCNDTISRGTLRRILKKYGVFSRNADKNSVWRRKASVFVQNGVSICSRSCFLFGRMLFLLMKQECASPATEMLEFFEEMERDFLKKYKKFFYKQSLMFWSATRSGGRKLLVKCPNKLNAVGYLEMLKIYETMHFLNLILQQDKAPVHKS